MQVVSTGNWEQLRATGRLKPESAVTVTEYVAATPVYTDSEPGEAEMLKSRITSTTTLDVLVAKLGVAT